MIANALAADFTVRQLRDLTSLFDVATREDGGLAAALDILCDAVNLAQTQESEPNPCAACGYAHEPDEPHLMEAPR
jgi:hypothetical protein